MKSLRVMVGLLWHEGNSFNPLPTMADDFVIHRQEAVIEAYRSSRTVLGGIIRSAHRQGTVLIPAVAARARPGGPIEQSAVDLLVAEFVSTAERTNPDAICLELHGATISTNDPDVEGTLLTKLREAVGPHVPIVVAADLHGYITEAMMAGADVITGYRTNPHSDMVETGERAYALMLTLIEGTRPMLSYRRVPFLMPSNDLTASGPLAEVGHRAELLRADTRIVDISIFNTQPQLDCPDTGQSILVYAKEAAYAGQCARTLAAALWDRRAEFVSDLPSLHGIIDDLRATPVALGDFGDRVLAGAPGDSLCIVQAIRQLRPDLKVVSHVFDPQVVEQAQQAGKDSTATLAVGGKISSASVGAITPLRADWHIQALGQARFINRGPYMAGVAADLGHYAILRNGNTTVIATSKAPNVHDPEAFEALGLPIRSHDVIVLKSGLHFHLSFAGLCTTRSVATPGLSTADLSLLPFASARPIYPLDEVVWS
jgi:microcystin degradation protein MlrC